MRIYIAPLHDIYLEALSVLAYYAVKCHCKRKFSSFSKTMHSWLKESHVAFVELNIF